MAALAEDKESGSKVNKEFLISSATAANTLLSAVPQATAPSALVGTGLTLWGALPEKDSSTVYPSASLQASAYITAMRLGLVAAPGPDAGAASWYDARSGKVYLGNAQAVEDFNAWMSHRVASPMPRRP